MHGLEEVGQGATAKIFRDGTTAIKLYTDASLHQVQEEARLQRFAFNAGLPVPEVLGIRELNGNKIALDMTYICGRSLMRPGMDKDEIAKALDTLIKLQQMVHSVDGSGLPSLSCRLVQRIEHTPYLDAPRKERLTALLSRLGNGSGRLCHGDLHPLNILYDGEKHWIIDWVDAAAGDFLADACRTYLLFKQYIARKAGIYLRAYCKATGAKQDDVMAWLPVVAAARLSENIDEKSRGLLLGIVSQCGY